MFQLINRELTSHSPAEKSLLQERLGGNQWYTVFLPLANSLCVQISLGETECT